MTENKRFIRIVDHLEKEVRIYDIINEKKLFNIFFNELDSAICLNGALTDTVDLLNTLSDENEQLKSTIKEVTELLSEEVDLFSDKATEHDIIAYRELNQLDNKDAYYIATATKKAIKMLKELME